MLKTENLNLKNKISKLEELVKVNEMVWKKDYEDDKLYDSSLTFIRQKAEAKSHYHDGIRHQIHIKFKSTN